MISRRKFVQTLAVAAAGVYTSGSLLACSMQGKRKLGNIGYITGILGRSLREGDWKSILRQTADFGYSEIETGSFLGDSAQSFLEFCSEIGLKPIVGGTQFTTDREVLLPSLEKLNALQLKYAVVYWPWQVGENFNLEQCKVSADILNQMGTICKEQGLLLCWHNHDKEFIPMEEGLPFDYLLQNTDKELVQCELDIYWTQKGGADPIETLKKFPGRYPILHVKDMAPGPEQDFACPGSGIIDWPGVFAESHEQGIMHYFVERDNEQDGIGCLRGSAEYLTALRF